LRSLAGSNPNWDFVPILIVFLFGFLSALSFSFLILAKNPELTQKLYSEIRKLRGKS
jgi:hypothetical protein